VRSRRAYLLQSLAGIWKRISAGEELAMQDRIVIRGASTNAIHKAREAVDFAYNAAGRDRDLRQPSAGAAFSRHPYRDQQLQGGSVISKPSARG
jgi:hypothetical protein